MQPMKYETPDLKIEIRQDEYNWIIIYGPKTLKSFDKHAERWYFNSLEGMLLRLFKFLRNQEVGTLDLDGIRKANAIATLTITQIASGLEDHLALSHKKDNDNEKSN